MRLGHDLDLRYLEHDLARRRWSMLKAVGYARNRPITSSASTVVYVARTSSCA
jgi:hypothetical protein